MPTVGNDGSFVTFNDDEAARFALAGGPDLAYFDELINNYALAQGGDVLAVWECLQGPRLGKKIKWSPDRIPSRVGISQPRMNEILDDTMAAVLPAWEASPQYARFERTTPAEAADAALGNRYAISHADRHPRVDALRRARRIAPWSPCSARRP